MTLKEYLKLNEAKKVNINFSKKGNILLKRMKKIASKKGKFNKEIIQAQKIKSKIAAFETKVKNNKINKEQAKEQAKQLVSETKIFIENGKKSGFTGLKIVMFFVSFILISISLILSMVFGFQIGTAFGVFISEEIPELSNLFEDLIEALKEGNNKKVSRLINKIIQEAGTRFQDKLETFVDGFSSAFNKIKTTGGSIAGKIGLS